MGTIRNALDDEADDEAIVADKMKKGGEDEEDTCSSSSQVHFLYAVFVFVTPCNHRS